MSGTIESWELPGDGPFLFPIDAQAKLGLIKDMAKSRIFIENKPGFHLRIYKDAKTGLMLISVADFDLLNDQALTPQLLRASKPMYALAATIPPPTCESHVRQMEQDDRFVSGVLTAQSCENLLHCDVEPNTSFDIMIVSDIDLPSKPSSKYIVTSHSLQPESSAQPSPTSDSILCTAHALLETCCHMKAKLLILTIAYPGAWEVLFHVDLCNVLHTLAGHGIDFIYHTPCRVSSQYNLPRDFHH